MRKSQHRLALSLVFLMAASLGGLSGYGQASNPQTGAKDSSHSAKSGAKKSKKGEGRGLIPVESASESSGSQGGYYALVIGINNYRSLPKLRTAVYDATELAKLLHEQYGFAPPKLLLNPTRKEIMVALNEYRRSLPARSNLVIYYAGHGQKDQKTKKAYWLPADAEPDSDVNWISASTITEEISGMPSQHVLVISDSCYSGELSRGLPPLQINAGERQAYFRRMLESPSRTLMSSGRDEPVADDGSAGHSTFAYVLLASLEQIEDNTFTAGYLFQTYVQQAVGGEVGSEQVPQYSPIMNSGHQWGDFVFSRKGGRKLVSDGTTGSAKITNTSGASHSSAGSDDSDTVGTANHLPNGGPKADRDAISEVIRRYEEAYRMRDADALWRIWPNSAKKTRDNIGSAFKIATSIRMDLTLGTPEVAPDGGSATVKGQFSELFTPKDGSPQPRSGDITLLLKKNNGTWTIADIK